MESRDKEKTNKIDWKKKGLGWIPDYPDLRDYQLAHKDVQKDGRLKREGATDEIENISETVIKIINVLQKVIIKQEQNELKEQINELENKVFGGISFVNVRLYKLLREQPKEPNNFCFTRDYYYKNELSRQILELKKYLSILVLKYSLKLSKELVNQIQFKEDIYKPIDFKLFENPTSTFRWLGQGEFDQETKFLVMLFQHYSGIQVDGVVGLETYTTFNEYLCNPKNLEKLETSIKAPEKKSKLQSEINFSPKTRLVSAPSLIPSTLFSLIFQELKSTAKESIQRELIDHEFLEIRENLEKILFEIEFLETLRIEECEIFATHLGNSITGKLKEIRERLNEKELQPLLEVFFNQALAEHLPSKTFNEIFYNEFFLVEPLVSFVVKIMSPLAQWRNIPLEDIVSNALTTAKNLFYKSFAKNHQSANSTISPDRNHTNTRFNYVEMEKLAKEALQRATLSFETGIKLIIQEDLNIRDNKNSEIKDKITSTLCFYFIVKKFLNQFIKPAEQCRVINARQANIFDKQELFEVGALPIWQQTEVSSTEPKGDNETSCETKLELFPTPQLQIPVSNSLIKSLESRSLREPHSPKLYLFLPSVVDLSYWDSAVEDQGSLQSCTAFAGIALIEYFANRRRGKSIDLSPLFLYKVARNLMSLNGDVGASVRETMKAMALFGVPPEQYWAYEEDKVDEEPPPFCYSYAQNFQSLKYFRLDYADMPTEVLLSQIKAVLAAGFPCMFGFTVYTSAYETCNLDKGYIPFPSVEKDRLVGGHAVVAVGYDDLQTIPRADRTSDSRGAFLIRNSWGTDWGKEGYGWIPYDYILQGLTRDWWSLLKSEWFDEDSFGLGARNIGGDPHTNQPGGSGGSGGQKSGSR